MKWILILLITIIVIFLYVLVFSMMKIAKKSDENIEKQASSNCFNCIFYQTDRCLIRSEYIIENCPDFVPLIPFA